MPTLSLTVKTSIKSVKRTQNSAIELVQWPVPSASTETNLVNKVLAIQTTRMTVKELCDESASPYQGFNLGLHVGDCAKQVEINRYFLQELLPSNSKIQWLEQVHGNTAVAISQVSEQVITADAAVTNKRNICLAIMTADCLPILLVSKKGDEIAAIHGGWRPLAANIITNTLNKMTTPADDIYAWLGPCISKNSFEVGAEVKAQFVQQHECFDAAFTAALTESKQGKYLADLHKMARLQLEKAGINHISALPECTYSNTDKYYSYRKNNITGRMATLICLL